METLVATAGLIAVGAFTPGPNNLIVLRVSAISGWRSAIPSMAGIIVGGLALVAIVAGAGGLFSTDARLTVVMSAGACLLLAAYGLNAIVRTFGPSRVAAEGPQETLSGFGSLFAFQFLNPKGWLLVVAAVASLGVTPTRTVALVQVGALFFLIPAVSLTLWSVVGTLVMNHLDRRPVRIWFDRVTGCILIGFAILLMKGAVDAI